ncbi:MAG: zinc ABC transporter substrate-binding protein [Eubacteriales bacterium]|nr:zinc ABC transporter substrate-binding protein [Eubacteriales bacterium]
MKLVKSKVFSLLLAGAMVFGFAGIAANKSLQAEEAKKPIVTVTTSFLYDMVDQLAGDRVDRELIIAAGQDPHLYEPKPADLDKLQKADLILYHGLHFEGKMVDVLESQEKSVAVSKTFLPEEIGVMVDGGKHEIDPHFWFDISLYKKACQTTAEALDELLPEAKADIDQNLETYLGKLDELDTWVRSRLDEIPEGSRTLVTPHDAFSYFGRAYNMEVLAPQGVSTDSEVANKDMEDCASYIAEHGIKAIFAESSTNPQRMIKLAEIVKSKGGECKVLKDDSEQLFSDSLAAEGNPGDNYIDMYHHNVDMIVDNLK